MVNKVLKARFDKTREEVHTNINKTTKQAKNRFLTEYQYIAEKTKSKMAIMGSAVIKLFGNLISYGDWFPASKLQITNQRLEFIKYAYILPFKKASSEAEIKLEESNDWPNQ